MIITRNDIKLQWTYFESVSSSSLQTRESTWSALCEQLSAPKVYASKAAAPLIKLAVFHADHVTAQLAAGGHRSPRCAVNLDRLTGVEGDYDVGEMDLFEAAMRLEAADIECFLYTTPSHTPTAPRWRVLAPLLTPADPEQRAELLGQIDAALGGVLSLESYASTQAFYIGAVEGAQYEWMHVRGRLLRPEVIPVQKSPKPDNVVDFAIAWSPQVEADLRAALKRIPADERDTWIKVGQALASYGDAARDLWIEWSKTSDKWQPEDAARWSGFRPHRITPKTIFYLAKEYARQEPEKSEALPADYIRNDNGSIKALHVNLVYWLSQRDEAKTLRWDTFYERTMLGEHAVSDQTCAEYRTRAESELKLSWSLKAVSEAFAAVGYRRSAHAVRDYLHGLEWDQVPRVGRFFATYYGLDDGVYHSKAAWVLFLSAVWRVLEPGCQADQSLLLVGHEGVGKSYGMGTLFFSDKGWVLEHIPDLHQKDAAAALRGKWMVELSEMDAARRSEIETLKAFMTRREEHYRPAYAVHEVTRPRQCVLVGTSNDFTLLDSMDANRRFLPLVLGDKPANLDDIKRDREQLWAEAFMKALLGEKHGYLTPMNTPGLEQARRDISREDPHYEKIAEYLADKERVRLDEIYDECLFVPVNQRTYNLARRMGNILRHMDWRKKTIREGQVTRQYWVPIEEEWT